MTARAKSPHAAAVERIVRREYRYENGDGARALRASILRLVARVEREAWKQIPHGRHAATCKHPLCVKRRTAQKGARRK